MVIKLNPAAISAAFMLSLALYRAGDFALEHHHFTTDVEHNVAAALKEYSRRLYDEPSSSRPVSSYSTTTATVSGTTTVVQPWSMRA